ncbi:hypothetical protein TNCV_645151 [Trichonephila clavipes]|nr:hypothetical protein TNCV_645151 [Trichonephila clavipes]
MTTINVGCTTDVSKRTVQQNLMLMEYEAKDQLECPYFQHGIGFGAFLVLVSILIVPYMTGMLFINGDRYRAMITNFFIPELNNHDVQELWFQQDGATCDTARAPIDLLKDTFGDRLISRFGPVN